MKFIFQAFFYKIEKNFTIIKGKKLQLKKNLQ